MGYELMGKRFTFWVEPSLVDMDPTARSCNGAILLTLVKTDEKSEQKVVDMGCCQTRNLKDNKRNKMQIILTFFSRLEAKFIS